MDAVRQNTGTTTATARSILRKAADLNAAQQQVSSLKVRDGTPIAPASRGDRLPGRRRRRERSDNAGSRIAVPGST